VRFIWDFREYFRSKSRLLRTGNYHAGFQHNGGQ
jgi:hypothetical protein